MKAGLRLDFGGIGKGLALDHAVRRLKAHGVFLQSMGGVEKEWVFTFDLEPGDLRPGSLCILDRIWTANQLAWDAAARARPWAARCEAPASWEVVSAIPATPYAKPGDPTGAVVYRVR